jgi:hypothetical protein
MSHENAHPTRADDLLAAYELGLLNETDRLRFEQATLDDPDLLDELFDHASAAQALREDPERFASLLRETLREADPSLAERLTGWLNAFLQPKVLAPVVVAAAAVFALVVLPDGDDLRKIAVLDPAPYVQVDVRGAESDAATLYFAAMTRYADERYGEAADLLDEALAAGDETWHQATQARLYLGVSRLLDGDPEAALAPLGVSAASSQLAVAEPSRWYRAQAYLLIGDAPAAREALQGLVDSPVFGARAAAQLERLDEEDDA